MRTLHLTPTERLEIQYHHSELNTMPYAHVTHLYQLITMMNSSGQDTDMPLNPIKHKYKLAHIYACAYVHVLCWYVSMKLALK
jgi:hypothetical protein